MRTARCLDTEQLCTAWHTFCVDSRQRKVHIWSFVADGNNNYTQMFFPPPVVQQQRVKKKIRGTSTNASFSRHDFSSTNSSSTNSSSTSSSSSSVCVEETIDDKLRTAYIRAQTATLKSSKTEALATKSGKRSAKMDYQFNEDDYNLLTGEKCPGLLKTMMAQVNKEHCMKIFGLVGIDEPGYAEFLAYHLARCILAPDMAVVLNARNNETKPSDNMTRLFMQAQADPVGMLQELEFKPLKVLLLTLMVSSFKPSMGERNLQKEQKNQSAFYPDRKTDGHAMSVKASRLLAIVTILINAMNQKTEEGSLEWHERTYIALTLALDPTGGVSNNTFKTLHKKGMTPKASKVNEIIGNLAHQLSLYWMFEKPHHDEIGYDDGTHAMVVVTADNADCEKGKGSGEQDNMIVICAHTGGNNRSNGNINETRRFTKQERDLLDAATKSRGTTEEGGSSMPQANDWKYMAMSPCEEKKYDLFRRRRLFHGLVFARKYDSQSAPSVIPIFTQHDKVEVQLHGSNAVVAGIVESWEPSTAKYSVK